MKRPYLTFILSALLLTGFAQGGTMPDWANKKGAFGIGGNTTLGGTNGLNTKSSHLGAGLQVRTFVSNTIHVQANFGYHFSGDKYEDDNYSSESNTHGLTFGANLGYIIAIWHNVAISTVLDVDAISGKWVSKNGPIELEGDHTGLFYGLDLMAEWFPQEFFGLHPSIGISLSLISAESEGATFSEQGGVNLAFFGSNDLLGSAGFTFWF